MNQLLEALIPPQKTGTSSGASSKLRCSSAQAANELFKSTVRRMFDVNRWYAICGKKGAEFHLCDRSGQRINTDRPKEGDLISIKLGAPPNPKGDGCDWVRIECIIEDYGGKEPMAGFRVRPVRNPKDSSAESAHFYTSEATSSFYTIRTGFTVCAAEEGRNEHSNPAGGLLGKLRNILIAIGAKMGFSYPQWKRLTKALLKPKDY